MPFPNYVAKFGWRAVGTRTDELGGRITRTVFYARAGRRIAYTIVSGRPLPSPARTRRAVREGTVLRYFRRAAAIVVTWPRGGHTCVLSGRGVPTGTLLELAGWKGKGAVAF